MILLLWSWVLVCCHPPYGMPSNAWRYVSSPWTSRHPEHVLCSSHITTTRLAKVYPHSSLFLLHPSRGVAIILFLPAGPACGFFRVADCTLRLVQDRSLLAVRLPWLTSHGWQSWLPHGCPLARSVLNILASCIPPGSCILTSKLVIFESYISLSLIILEMNITVLVYILVSFLLFDGKICQNDRRVVQL